MKKDLLKTALKLEEITIGVGNQTEVLVDISDNFKSVVTSMNEAVYRGDQALFYNQHHRELRIMAELMLYTIEKLSASNVDLVRLNETLLGEAKGMAKQEEMA